MDVGYQIKNESESKVEPWGMFLLNKFRSCQIYSDTIWNTTSRNVLMTQKCTPPQLGGDSTLCICNQAKQVLGNPTITPPKTDSTFTMLLLYIVYHTQYFSKR